MSAPSGVLPGRSCWIFSDGKAGNDVQTFGVAKAMGLVPLLKRVAPSGVQKLLSPWAGVAKRERFGQTGAAFAPPWPDIALAIGRLTTPYVRELKRRAGDATFTVILQDPKVSLSAADLFWVPEHDRLRGPNVITTLTAPHGFSAQAIAALRREMPPEYMSLPQPRVAVLLGGSNGDYRYSQAALQRLRCALESLGTRGASFLITPSRRSEPAIVECARRATEAFPRLFWDMQGRNPYPEYLAFADVFLTPADSVNMTGEPCATGRPVYVFHPDGGSPKFTRFHAALNRYGATRPFPDTFVRLERWNYAPLNSAALIADQIARHSKQTNSKTLSAYRQ
jgi:mitochondrial fission protein ELM1